MNEPQSKKIRSGRRTEASHRRQKRRSQKIKLLKKMNQSDRKKNAETWLRGHIKRNGLPQNLVKKYQRRYRVDKKTAFFELAEIGYYEEIQIDAYEQDGVEWEFKVDGYDGEMKVVPKGTKDSDSFEF